MPVSYSINNRVQAASEKAKQVASLGRELRIVNAEVIQLLSELVVNLADSEPGLDSENSCLCLHSGAGFASGSVLNVFMKEGKVYCVGCSRLVAKVEPPSKPPCDHKGQLRLEKMKGDFYCYRCGERMDILTRGWSR